VKTLLVDLDPTLLVDSGGVDEGKA